MTELIYNDLPQAFKNAIDFLSPQELVELQACIGEHRISMELSDEYPFDNTKYRPIVMIAFNIYTLLEQIEPV